MLFIQRYVDDPNKHLSNSIHVLAFKAFNIFNPLKIAKTNCPDFVPMLV